MQSASLRRRGRRPWRPGNSPGQLPLSADDPQAVPRPRWGSGEIQVGVRGPRRRQQPLFVAQGNDMNRIGDRLVFFAPDTGSGGATRLLDGYMTVREFATEIDRTPRTVE